MSVNPDYIKHCPHGGMFPEETEQAVLELINLKDKPDAIFIAGDRLSIGCLEVLKKLNIKVPEQIALAGFSNSDVLNLLSIPSALFDNLHLKWEKLQQKCCCSL